MKKIYKYEVNPQVKMPLGAEILTVQLQHEIPHLWAIIDQNQTLDEVREFVIVGTGHDMEDTGLRYIGTFQMLDGNFIGHVFEKIIIE